MNSLRSRVLRAPSRALPLAARSQTRYFHPTKPAPLINEALDATAGLIHGVHDITGLPWVASLPLTALIVRTFVGFPLQMYMRANVRRERDLAPLKQAYGTWAALQKKNIKGASTHIGQTLKVNRRLGERLKILNRRWNISLMARFAPLLQLPVWIMLMESIRGMSGSQNGLLPWLLSLVETSQESSDSAANSLHLTVEPTLATEGALWFPDLLAGDTTGILPAMLVASVLLNVQTGWKATPRADLADMPKMDMYRAVSFNGLRLFIQVLTLNVGLSAWLHEMPAALLIYWISSSSIATLQTYILEKKMFMKPPITVSARRYVGYNNPGASDPFHVKLR